MQVQFETLVRRANAEGITLGAVKSALAHLEWEVRQKAVKAAQAGWDGVEMVEPARIDRHGANSPPRCQKMPSRPRTMAAK